MRASRAIREQIKARKGRLLVVRNTQYKTITPDDAARIRKVITRCQREGQPIILGSDWIVERR